MVRTLATMNTVWQHRFLDLARHVSLWSKDPSTKVGAVIVDHQKRVVGIGYNGFPRGVSDSTERYNERAVKYKLIVHAEVNAILNATKSVERCELFLWPLMSCSVCIGHVIQSGITHIHFPEHKLYSPYRDVADRWRDDTQFSINLAHEAHINIHQFKWEE